MKKYYTYDAANGAANMLDRYEEERTGRRPYYVKRHFIINAYGERRGEYFTIHKRRYSKRMRKANNI